MKLSTVQTLLILLLSVQCMPSGFAQGLLDKKVTVEAKKLPVKTVLHLIESRYSFSFSYTGAVVPGDSLVTVNAKNKTVKEVLQMMLGDGFGYKEVDNHVIILAAEKEKWFTISGHVRDVVTGVPLVDASVIDRQQLASTLTGTDGHFRLKLKDKGRYATVQLTVSMGGFYNDTTLSLPCGYDQELAVMLAPANHALPDVPITMDMERSWFGRLLLSAQLRKQSANLGKFFVDKPVQASFVPGIGSHGKLSSQVTNKFSFNIMGGYAAGVNGVEIGGLFNIDKKDVRYVQIGGIFNAVGGSVTGVQIAGISNLAASMEGVQLSGITNLVRHDINGLSIAGICTHGGGTMKGIQLAGIVNLLTQPRTPDTACEMDGVQAAGIINIVNRNSRGLQLAGIANISRGGIRGVQISGICNITTRMEGFQFGLINIADTVAGYSFGLLNIVKKGYHTLFISTNDLMTINIAYKTGNRKLYSILTAGINTVPGNKVFALGVGAGSDRMITTRTSVAFDLTVMNLYEGYTGDNPAMIKADILFHWNIAPKFSVYSGPSICFIPFHPATGKDGYQYGVPQHALHDMNTGGHTAAWIGWQAGFHIF